MLTFKDLRPLRVALATALCMTLWLGLFQPQALAHDHRTPWHYFGKQSHWAGDVCGWNRSELNHSSNALGDGVGRLRTVRSEPFGSCNPNVALTKVDAHSLRMQFDIWDPVNSRWRYCNASPWMTRRQASGSMLLWQNVAAQCGPGWYVVWTQEAFRVRTNDPFVVSPWLPAVEAHFLPS